MFSRCGSLYNWSLQSSVSFIAVYEICVLHKGRMIMVLGLEGKKLILCRFASSDTQLGLPDVLFEELHVILSDVRSHRFLPGMKSTERKSIYSVAR